MRREARQTSREDVLKVLAVGRRGDILVDPCVVDAEIDQNDVPFFALDIVLDALDTTRGIGGLSSALN